MRVRGTGWERGTYGHHASGRRSGDEDLGGVGLILVDGPLDHVGNGVGVTAALMREGLPGADIPAGARVGRARVDGNEAVLLSKSPVRRVVEVGLAGSGAVVDCDNDAWRCGKIPRYVDVEACSGGPDAADLGELSWGGSTLPEDSCRCHGQAAGEDGEETHGVDDCAG